LIVQNEQGGPLRPSLVRFIQRAAYPTWKSDADLYLTRDGRVVGADDPDRHTVLVGKGKQLRLDVARRLGLVEDQPQPLSKIAAKPRDKAIRKKSKKKRTQDS
jgi:hypothetical protein